jgi:hypothetical protein
MCEASEKTGNGPGNRRSAAICGIAQITRAPFRITSQNRGSDETNGTFTVFVKLTMCDVRL